MSLYYPFYPFFISQVKLDFMKNNSQDGQYNSQYLKKLTVGLNHTSRSQSYLYIVHSVFHYRNKNCPKCGVYP